MKRISALLFLANVFTLTAVAHEISADQSLHKAVGSATQISDKADFALIHTQTSGLSGKALYYVFSNGQNSGFLITGADHRAHSVLGYAESGTFHQAMSIPAFRSWLKGCESAMQWLSEQADTADEYALPMHNTPDCHFTNEDNTISVTFPGRQYTDDPTLPASVKPLLGGIVWDQGEPYNGLCPEIEIDGKPDRCATGCVATATAQVMKYWQWPRQGTGSISYTSFGDSWVTLQADFSESIYDWDNMLDDYSGDYTDSQADAVAKLMRDVGIAEKTNYSVSSGASPYSPATAMTTYFGYNKGMQLCDRLYYTSAEWNNLLKSELAASRPLIYRGVNSVENNGHAFVIDGYDAEGRYHVNWGWSGKCNGYFDINYMEPDNLGIGVGYGGYIAEQEVNINCCPDPDGTSQQHYQIQARTDVSIMSDGTLDCSFINVGLAPYSDGKFGYIALIDNEIVGSVFKDIGFLDYGRFIGVSLDFDDLGVTDEMIGDKLLKIYPVYQDGEELKVPRSMVSFQNYILLTLKADGGLVIRSATEENTEPVCQSIEMKRDYLGFRIKGKAMITAQEGHPDFVRDITMYLHDENGKTKAMGTTCGYVNEGQSREIEFTCDPYYNTSLEAGTTYYVSLAYYARGRNFVIPGSQTTVTLKDPGPEADLSYRNFTLDRDTLAPGELFTVSFDVVNNGGFGVESYYATVYRYDDPKRLGYPRVDADLLPGTTTVSKTLRADYEAGDYYISVYACSADGDQNLISPEPLPFTIEGSEAAISTISADDRYPAPCYDLMGRRVPNPTTGLYVRGQSRMAGHQRYVR